MRSFKLTMVAILASTIAAVSFMSAAPAHAAPVRSDAAVSSPEALVQTLTKELQQAPAGDTSATAIPAALVGVIALCGGTALASVGQSVIRNLIAQGNIGRARDLLAEAVAGCVFGVAGGAVGAACRVFPPCRRAVTTAIEKVVRKIIDELS